MKMVFQAETNAERILGEKISQMVGLVTKKSGIATFLFSVSTRTITIHHIFVGCC
jgi:hypothetical protein